MATYRLETVDGKKDAEHTVLYDLTQDGVALGTMPYREAMDKALELSRPGDRYQEVCNGRMYCDQTIEDVWESHAKIERHFAADDMGRLGQIEDWLAGKRAGRS